MSAMKVVILKGDERHVEALMRENKVRVSRGHIEFAPADSIPTPEGVSEEDVKDMVKAIESRDARIAELMTENETLKAALAEKQGDDTPDPPDTKEVEETDNKEAEETDTKDAPSEDTKEVEETAAKKRTSKK